MAQIIPLPHIARAMNDARAIGNDSNWVEAIKRDRLVEQLHNEVQFYRSHRDRVAAEAERARKRNALREALFFIAGAATALYVIGVIALAGWVS